MKALTTILTTLTISLALTSAANAANNNVKLIAADQSVTTQLCMTAVKGSRSSMSKAIKTSGLSNKFIATKVECNGQHITDFVAKYGRSPEKVNAIIMRHNNQGTVSISDLASL